MPVVRSVVSLPAGMTGMPLPKFLALTTAGTGVWNAAFIAAGWFLAEKWHRVDAYMGPVGLAVVGLIVVGLGILAWRRRRERAPVRSCFIRVERSDVARAWGRASWRHRCGARRAEAEQMLSERERQMLDRSRPICSPVDRRFADGMRSGRPRAPRGYRRTWSIVLAALGVLASSWRSDHRHPLAVVALVAVAIVGLVRFVGAPARRRIGRVTSTGSVGIPADQARDLRRRPAL